ncbi:glycosyltransferase family A protein [Crenobacter cavernae]|uniref:Glycosyltransferase n=1 Tax=Crenobacter cavernae TaxID=2290923 RepID=A0A345Y511_9NEIS|nr:glycosyltransferase [Crenobacter cavernae]AXK39013.1 glycosyltransferase [Crenobacter cavernae]
MTASVPRVVHLLSAEPAGRHALGDAVCRERGIEQRVLRCEPVRGRVFDLLAASWSDAPFSVVHVHDDRLHFLAALWRLVNRKPFSIVRSWYAPTAVGSGWLKNWQFRNKTDVNLVADEPLRKHFADGDRAVWLPNIYRLDYLGQPLEESLADCYRMLSGHIPGRASHEHIRLTYITHFYCNQKSIDSVTDLLELYAGYSEEVRQRVQFVIVDDGSPIEYEIPDVPLNLTWIKIDEDIRWNQGGARNVGVVYAKSDNVLVTDLDHRFPEESLKALCERPPCGKRLYKVWRKDGQGNWEKAHPNIFFLSRGRFFERHGYDEEFTGRYGAEDVRFVKYHKATGTWQRYLPKTIWCQDRVEIDRSKSYHSLTRDLSGNTPVDARKTLELKYHGHGAGHSRSFLNFTWTIACDRRLDAPAEPLPVDIAWKWGTVLRQILPRGY